jgi:hypothetical protein
MTSAVIMSQMDTTGEQHRHPTHFLGRPVRLYNPEGNTYHTDALWIGGNVVVAAATATVLWIVERKQQQQIIQH